MIQEVICIPDWFLSDADAAGPERPLRTTALVLDSEPFIIILENSNCLAADVIPELDPIT